MSHEELQKHINHDGGVPVPAQDVFRIKKAAGEFSHADYETVFSGDNVLRPIERIRIPVYQSPPAEIYNRAKLPKADSYKRLHTQPERAALNQIEKRALTMRDIITHPLASLPILAEPLEPYYRAVNSSLQDANEYGFTGHDIHHVFEVAQRALYVLEQAFEDKNPKLIKEGMVDKEARAVVLLSSLFHDLEFNRKQHSETAPVVARRLFPWLYTENNQRIMKRVDRAIEMHSHDDLITAMRDHRFGNNPDEMVQILSENYAPEISVLYIGDKLHRGKDRVTKKNMTREAFKNYPHAVNNFFWTTSDARTNVKIEKKVDPETKQESEEKVFTWCFDFTPELSAQHKAKYPWMSKTWDRNTKSDPDTNPKSLLAYMPPLIEAEYKHAAAINTPTSYFNLLRKKLWQDVYDKMFVTAIHTFALMPHLDRFDFVFVNPDDPEHPVTEVLERNNLQNGIRAIKDKYHVSNAKVAGFF